MEFKLITAVLTKSVAIEIIKRLKDEKGIITANTTHARGTSSNSDYMMKAEEILTILVEVSYAEEIFNFLYLELELDKPHQGIIYQEAISKASKYELPLIPNNSIPK